MTVMPDEYKARVKILTDALRSGEYSQVQNRLRKDEGFCCLGVACDVYHKETGLGEWHGEEGHYIFVDNEAMKVIMPKTVAEWFGFASAAGQHYASDIEDYELITLYDLNDSLGWSFEKIADYIDRNVESLSTPIRPESIETKLGNKK